MKNICFIFFIVASIVAAQPINTNGGFEDAVVGEVTGTDVPGWTLYSEGESLTLFEIIDSDAAEGVNSLIIVMSFLGQNAWDVQAVNEPVLVQPNTTYRYSVWAKAGIPGPVVHFTVGDPTYTEWGRIEEIISDQWAEYSLEFTTPADADTGRVPIHFSASGNESYIEVPIYIDDLRIEQVSVDVEESGQNPSEFILYQNYPNPFNPVTTIAFNLPVRSEVRLNLINLLGQMVKDITSGNLEAGRHEIKLDASDLSSGVYFYRLEAGEFISTRRLVLLK